MATNRKRIAGQVKAAHLNTPVYTCEKCGNVAHRGFGVNLYTRGVWYCAQHVPEAENV